MTQAVVDSTVTQTTKVLLRHLSTSPLAALSLLVFLTALWLRASPLHLEQNGEENNEKSVDEEDFGEEWFCLVYGWKL